MILVRLHPNASASWALFPMLEARAVEMIRKYCPQIPVELYVAGLRQRFTNTPDLTFYVLLVDPEGMVHAHFIAWIETAWNKLVVHINQLETDEGVGVSQYRGEIIAEMDKWVSGLNAQYEAAGQPHRIEEAEMWSWHAPAFWQRYLRAFREVMTIRHVYRFKVGTLQSADQPEKLHS